MHQCGKQRQKKQRPVPQNKGKSPQQNKGKLYKNKGNKTKANCTKTKATKQRQTVQKQRQRITVGNWKFHDSLGAENHALRKKMPWRNGTSSLVHQCDSHHGWLVREILRRPITFMRRGRISDSRSASWRIRGPIFKISMVRGRSPRRALKTGSTTFQRKRGALRCCSMPFHICLAVGTSHHRCYRRKRKHDRKDGVSQLVELRDRHMPKHRSR